MNILTVVPFTEEVVEQFQDLAEVLDRGDCVLVQCLDRRDNVIKPVLCEVDRRTGDLTPLAILLDYSAEANPADYMEPLAHRGPSQEIH